MAKGSILLISCYELGHQPAGIYMPMGFLRRAGYQAEAIDISMAEFSLEKIAQAKFIGISVPMHTALRLGLGVAEKIRKLNRLCHICFYGLYALCNADYLLNTVADSIIGGEVEEALLALISSVEAGEAVIDIEGVRTKDRNAGAILSRLNFALPDREMLPPLKTYARLADNGEERLAGYLETSRG